MTTLRVAIVGAGGNIGRFLLARLAREGSIAARGICRNELTAAPLRLAGFDVRCGSVSDVRAAQDLVGDCDVLVNCASAVALPGTARRQERGIVEGLLGVRGPRRLIHFSSVAVHGTCIPQGSRHERPRPDWPFGREKLNLERFLRRAARRSPGHQLVILRMGHVYGAEQWLSRFVFDEVVKGTFRLPFDGRTASNAVHVQNVASAVHALVSSDVTGTFNLFDAPQSTWRQVFDWNTAAIGAAPVGALGDGPSEMLRAHLAGIARAPARQLVREVAAWAKSLPLSLASSSQQVRFLAMNALATLQSPKLEAHVIKRFFGGHLDRRQAVSNAEPAWLFSEAAPGPNVDYRPEVTAEDARAVARWYRGYSSPDALAPPAGRTAENAAAQA